MTDLTHASFFSGAGGVDLGLARSGWKTVSTSEIEPYAVALLDERYPDATHLGDITTIDPEAIPDATLWTGGFPCQDLSTAGRRRGFTDGDRSVLAFVFLDLLERRRPRAVVLENVPGLLTSNHGRDMARLVGEVGDLGYGWAFRTLDARWFGVPQRRRRVFLVALRSGLDDADGHRAADRAAAVLAVGTRCPRHPGSGRATRPDDPAGARTGLELAGSLTRRYGKGVNTTLDDGALVVAGTLRTHPRPGSNTDGAIVVGTAADAARVRAPHGLAGRVDDLDRLAPTINAPTKSGGWRYDADQVEALVFGRGSGGPQSSSDLAPTLRVGPRSVDAGGPGDAVPIVLTKRGRARSVDTPETWGTDAVAPALNLFDNASEVRATVLIGSQGSGDDPLLPAGLDGHRYRLTGNGVVAPVAAWIGARLARALEEEDRG